MSESAFPRGTPDQPAWAGATPDEEASNDESPQFGAVDIVEAFTAMRHEWRSQTKESRALAEQIQAAAEVVRSVESRLIAGAAERPSEPSAEAVPLAALLVETDHQLTRAAAAIAQWETNRKRRDAADADDFDRTIAGMSRAARWFARPLLAAVVRRRALLAAEAEHPAIEGLNMVLARLRRTMHEQGIERLDVQGRPFDAETMHAVGTVETAGVPSGHVAEQFSPAYRWNGKLLRFAEVRTAT